MPLRDIVARELAAACSARSQNWCCRSARPSAPRICRARWTAGAVAGSSVSASSRTACSTYPPAAENTPSGTAGSRTSRPASCPASSRLSIASPPVWAARGRVSEGRNTIGRLERSRSGRRCPLDLRVHGGHVEGPALLDEVDEGGLRQRPPLGEHEDLLAEDHEGGNGLDPGPGGELALGFGVDLGEDDLGIGLGGPLEGRREPPTRSAPAGPEVDQQDVAVDQCRLEGVPGERDGGHVMPPERGYYPRGYKQCTPAVHSATAAEVPIGRRAHSQLGCLRLNSVIAGNGRPGNGRPGTGRRSHRSAGWRVREWGTNSAA